MSFLQSVRDYKYRVILALLIVGFFLWHLFLKPDEPLNTPISQQVFHSTIEKANSQVLSNNKGLEITHHGSPLTINRALRTRFDDIIFTLQQTSNLTTFPTSALTALSQEFDLSFDANRILFDLFSRYKDYTQAIAQLKHQGPELGETINLNAMHNFIKQINMLQTEFFSDLEIDAFFKQDAQYAEQTLERISIRQDPSLTKEQKTELIQHHINQLNDKDRNALQPSLNANKVAKHIDSTNVIALDMDPDTILRAEKIQEENRKWKEKVINYQHYIDEQNSKGIPQDVITHKLDAYLSENFTQNELKRLKVFLAHPELL
ncbi:lipase chaperone family protein [uncultured Shewanella sp.]|uniref:lipase chaperone family protein n=1 Tax=uncultured Shewanella sp. TaxID=173975 RepID=UPI00261631F5|nr:lipase chaperone family protein [uncultured Shewanella sp.]